MIFWIDHVVLQFESFSSFTSYASAMKGMEIIHQCFGRLQMDRNQIKSCCKLAGHSQCPFCHLFMEPFEFLLYSDVPEMSACWPSSRSSFRSCLKLPPLLDTLLNLPLHFQLLRQFWVHVKFSKPILWQCFAKTNRLVWLYAFLMCSWKVTSVFDARALPMTKCSLESIRTLADRALDDLVRAMVYHWYPNLDLGPRNFATTWDLWPYLKA